MLSPVVARAGTGSAAPASATASTAAAAAAVPGVPCYGLGNDGRRVQVLYVRPAGAPSRLSQIQTFLEATVRRIDNVLDASAAETSNHSQHVRWVTTPPGVPATCRPTIVDVELTQPISADSFNAFRNDLHAQGFDHADRKYLAFFDAVWPSLVSPTCGVSDSPTGDTTPDPATNTNNNVTGIATVDQRCLDSERAPAHELMHVLGAVQAGAPNFVAGGHTVDGYDELSDGINNPAKCPTTHTYRYDCGHDDYYSAADPPAGSWLATHWNTADSGFLSPRAALQTASPPANDAFTSARLLSGPRGAVFGASNTGATKQTGEPDHGVGGGDKSIWYQWTASATAPMVFAVYNEDRTDFHPSMAVYTGATVNNPGPPVAQGTSSAQSPTFVVRLVFQAQAGTTYRIAIDGNSGAYGSLSFFWNYVSFSTALDFDVDGRTDIGVYRPSTGVWYLKNSGGSASATAFGLPADTPVPADYDGDGRTDIAVFRPATGVWYVQQSTGGGAATAWGVAGDIPVPGDYDGDGKADLGVFRPLTGVWYILPSGGAAAYTVIWGVNGDIPVPADWNGDTQADVAVYRPSTGTWYFREVPNEPSVVFGVSGDIPVPRSFGGNTRFQTDITVFRPGNPGVWYFRSASSSIPWGQTGDVPQPDAPTGVDLVERAAVFRPSNTTFYDQYFNTATPWGAPADRPLGLPDAIYRFV